jgi:hypothetical protein
VQQGKWINLQPTPGIGKILLQQYRQPLPALQLLGYKGCQGIQGRPILAQGAVPQSVEPTFLPTLKPVCQERVGVDPITL